MSNVLSGIGISGSVGECSDSAGPAYPDVNLQEAAFSSLVKKPGRSGSEVRFIRKYLRMRQTDLPGANMANHSVVSQWESRGESRRAWTTTPRWSASGWLHAPGLPTGFDLIENELKTCHRTQHANHCDYNG